MTTNTNTPAPLKVGDVVSHNGARREIADIVGGYALLTNNLDRGEWVQLMDLETNTPAPACTHDVELGELAPGLVESGAPRPCARCGVEVVQW